MNQCENIQNSAFIIKTIAEQLTTTGHPGIEQLADLLIAEADKISHSNREIKPILFGSENTIKSLINKAG